MLRAKEEPEWEDMEDSVVDSFEKVPDKNKKRQDSRTKKQLKERCRRERIGNALADLKALIYEREKKVDKVEILESAVAFVRDKRRKDDESSYLAGYNACLVEFTSFLMQAHFIDYQAKAALLGNISALSNEVQRRQFARLSLDQDLGKADKMDYLPNAEAIRRHFAETEPVEEPSSTQHLADSDHHKQSIPARRPEHVQNIAQNGTEDTHIMYTAQPEAPLKSVPQMEQVYSHADYKGDAKHLLPLAPVQIRNSDLLGSLRNSRSTNSEQGNISSTTSADFDSQLNAAIGAHYEQKLLNLKSSDANCQLSRAPLSRIENRCEAFSYLHADNALANYATTTMSSDMYASNAQLKTGFGTSNSTAQVSLLQGLLAEDDDNLPHSTTCGVDEINVVPLSRYQTAPELSFQDDPNSQSLAVFLQRMYGSRGHAQN